MGLKTGEIIGDWNKLDEEELGEFYCSPNNIRVSRARKIEQSVMGGGHVEEKRDAYSFFEKPEEERTLGKQ
jgi:hypothetical protein